MTDDVDLFDAAMERGATDGVRADIRELVDIATEVGTALGALRLSADERTALYQRALQLARRRRLAWLRGRAVGWRASALVGGGIVTAGALTAILIAVARGRQQHSPVPA